MAIGKATKARATAILRRDQGEGLALMPQG